MSLRFSAWFPLSRDAIEANTPDDAGLFELRVYGPLLVYPKGRSATVLCGATGGRAPTLRAALQGLEEGGLPEEAQQAVGRHPVYYRTARSARPAAELKRRLADFEMRFGSPPVGNR